MMIMTYYEIKKVFSKKGSKVALIFIFIVISVVLSFIIGDNKYVNRNGDAESGISAMLKVRELKKEWSGELTEDVLRKIIEENVRISQTPEAKSNDFRQNDIAYSQRQGFMDIRDLLNCDYGEFKTNSSVIAVIVPFILIFLPSFLSGTSLPLLNKILGLLPDQMLQMNQVVKFFNLYEIGGKVFCAVPILIISYSILLLLIVPVIYFIYRRKEVYN